ncbi:MAG: hypothetical protein WCR96_01760 [Candidatus Methanomethylophilaceae archaeon]
MSIVTQSPRPEHKLDEVKKSIGKTVSKIEFGETPDLRSEELCIHFTDGSILLIGCGSNAVNVANDHKFSWKEFTTDLITYWK